MPRIVKAGNVTDDQWLPPNPDKAPSANQVCTLEQWLALDSKAGSAVQLEPGELPAPLYGSLQEIGLIRINFPAFADGRGFSYARELREQGYDGELRACGQFLRDQVTYLKRCGFDAFQPDDESHLDGILESLNDFSEYYQASSDQPLPLFRRRG